MADQPIKKEKDFAELVDKALPEATKVAKKGQLNAALEPLIVLEKQTRNSGDVVSNERILKHILQLCFDAHDYRLLNEHIQVFSKKHGLLKQSVQRMTQMAIDFIGKIADEKEKVTLIDTLRTTTEGKIFVEVERARVTKILSNMKEKQGKIAEAADILQELQVETFGSMEKREKTDFILEQMRLCLLKKDFVRVPLMSKKISLKFFEDKENQDLKIRFYELLIQHALHEDAFLNVCKYYRQIYDTPVVVEDAAKCKEVLIDVILYIILSPFDNEQSDLIHRIYQDERVAELPLLQQLLKSFITHELMRWPKIEEVYGPHLKSTSVFNVNTEQGTRRLKALHNRVIEHATEEFLSQSVVSKTVYARIDRPAGVVSFVAPKDPNEILNDWSMNISSLLELIEKTNHLIAKEEMVHTITQVALK